MTYKEKLLDPRWQKKRLEIFERDKFTCRACRDSKTELQVHHTVYVFDKEPWEAENHHLVTLCRPCHELETELLSGRWDFSKALHTSGFTFLEVICLLCAQEDGKTEKDRARKIVDFIKAGDG